jgi:hypothetical protein
MSHCPECNYLIKETVVEGRKLIAQLHTSPHFAQGTTRYLTILKLSCECGERTERRYENRPSCEVNRALCHSR